MQKFLLILLQWVFAPALVWATFGYFDAVPKILNALLFYFVLPVAYWVGAKFLMQALWPFFEEEDLLPGFVSALTLWLALVVGTYLPPKTYFLLRQTGQTQFAEVAAVQSTHPASYWQLQQAKPDTSTVGNYHYSSRVKSGDSYTTTHHYYSVAALHGALPDGGRVCLGAYTNTLADMQSELARLKDWPSGTVGGVVVRDPYETSHYHKAMQQAGIAPAEASASVVLLPAASFEHLLHQYATAFWVYLAVVWCIWGLLPAYWVWRS